MAVLNLELDHPRYTRDIDLLGFTEITVSHIEQIIREICTIKVVEDGLVFDSNSVRGTLIKLHDEYPGVRVRFNAAMGPAKITNLQVDVAVGNTIYPKAKRIKYQGLLDLPEPTLRIYCPETILAEKIHTLEKLGFLNSRMKDVYDIWLITSNQKISGQILQKSLRTTFENRKTPYPELSILLDMHYPGETQRKAWNGIKKKLPKDEKMPEIDPIIDQLKSFIVPVMDALFNDKEFSGNWDPIEEAWT